MTTAVEHLKSYGLKSLPGFASSAENILSGWITGKDFSPRAVIGLSRAGLMGYIITKYVLGRHDYGMEPNELQYVCNFLLRNYRVRDTPEFENYTGDEAQNKRIDMALSLVGGIHPNGTEFGQWACNNFFSGHVDFSIPNVLRKTKIAIIGHGAAGIILQRALTFHGFSPMIFEKAHSLGLWQQENVYKRSRNNPKVLSVLGNTLDKAPGPGNHVKNLLENLAPGISKYNVKGVKKSGDGYLVHYDNESVYEASIVINCSGIGTPKSPHDPLKMITNATATSCGERWQRELKAGEEHRQMFIFIGLGNSTAEMLRQIHVLQDKGSDCDYRILTHYPEESVRNPNDTITTKHGKYRVFRDLSLPNLTSFQGDLPDSRSDYYRALRNGKIISDVVHWDKSSTGCVLYQTRPRRISKYIKADKLFCLIGYRNSTVSALGVSSSYYGPVLDYDGEVIDSEGERLKGYYCFGACAASRGDKNAIVLPGMLFRLHDLVPSIIMRAAETVLDSL